MMINYQWESLRECNADKNNLDSFLCLSDTRPYLFPLRAVRNAEQRTDAWHSDINALILDYLTMEGYPKAAAKFSKEANLQPQQDDPSIRERQEIQNSIHKGSIEHAIALLNELDPEVCPQFSFPFVLLGQFCFAMIRTRVFHAPRIWPVGR
jgi:hypothetical protein